jgi:hypothetical protein
MPRKPQKRQAKDSKGEEEMLGLQCEGGEERPEKSVHVSPHRRKIVRKDGGVSVVNVRASKRKPPGRVHGHGTEGKCGREGDRRCCMCVGLSATERTYNGDTPDQVRELNPERFPGYYVCGGHVNELEDDGLDWDPISGRLFRTEEDSWYEEWYC